MKLIVVIVALGAGVWYMMVRAKDNAALQQVANAPMQYTKSLQNDEARAKAALDSANKAVAGTAHAVDKAVEAQ